jgi:hypothetical protein
MYQVYQFSDGSFLTTYGKTVNFAGALVGSPQKLAAANTRRKRHAKWVLEHPKHYTPAQIADSEAELALTPVKREVVFGLKDAPLALPADVQRRLDFLDALEAAGVDNWDGYSFAQEAMEERA